MPVNLPRRLLLSSGFCPHCDFRSLRRSPCNYFFARALARWFQRYPWECGLCRRTYFVRSL